MKIALVSPYDFAHPGGVNAHVSHLADEFRNLGHQIMIVAPVSSDSQVPEDVIEASQSITTVKSGGSKSRISLSLRASGRIKRLLEQEKFDVVHVHNPLTPVVSMNFLRHRQVAPDTVFIATFHEYRDDKNPLFTLGEPLIHRWIEQLDGRIAVSEASRDFNNTYFPGEYTIIPNGIDTARFGQGEPIERYQDGRSNVLFVGRLEARKGFKYLLRAWPHVRQALPKARLLVVGAFEKKHKRPYVHYARKKNIYGVRFIGPASKSDLPRYYSTADLFCAPSTGFESFGIVLLEAMAAGTPVVASNIVGYRAVLEDGVQGLLVAPRAPLALAEAITHLLKNPELRAKMGQAGRAKALAHDWSHVASRVIDFYRQKLAEHRLAKVSL